MEMGAKPNMDGMGGMVTMGDEGHGCCCTDTDNPCEWGKSPGSDHDERATAALIKINPPSGPTATVAGLLELPPPPVFADSQGFPAGASPPGGPPVYLTIQSFLC
jgi:hypothetical protein